MNKKRISGGIIDFIIACIIQSILTSIFIMKPLVNKELDSGNVFRINLLVTLFSMLYMIFRDVIGGKSLGKVLLKLNIVDSKTKENVSFLRRILRNVTWLLGPIEIIVFIITNERLGDKLAKTIVIEKD